MRNSLALLALVVVVYMLPLGADRTWQQELIIKSALSMGLALTALALSKKPCFLVVAGCEMIALLYNTVVAVGYSLGHTDIDCIFEPLMSALFTVEILALTLGMLDELRRLQFNSHRDRFGGSSDKNSLRVGGGL